MLSTPLAKYKCKPAEGPTRTGEISKNKECLYFGIKSCQFAYWKKSRLKALLATVSQHQLQKGKNVLSCHIFSKLMSFPALMSLQFHDPLKA